MHRSRNFSRELLLAACVVLLAFVLRLIALERLPLHFDEGNNVYFGRQTWNDVLRDSIATTDTDPPGHRFALGYWMLGGGPTPFSIRLFSVCAGVIATAALFRIGRALQLSVGAAIFSAAVFAVAAYSIDNTQQAKGYALGAAAAALSWLFWLRGWRSGGSRRAAAAYVICTAIAVSTHFYTLALLPMQWLWLWLAHRSEIRNVKRTASRVGLQVAAVVPTALWAAATFDSVLRGSHVSSASVVSASAWRVLLRIFGEFALSRFAPESALVVGAGTLLCAAIVGGFLLRRNRAALAFGVALAVPVFASLMLSRFVPFFFPRFLLYALPSLCVLLAGLWRGALRWPLLVAALLCGGAGWSMFYTAPIDVQDDYRPLVRQLRALARDGDGALSTYIWIEGIVESYAPEMGGRIHWHVDQFGPDTVTDGMPRMAAAQRRLWSFNFRRDPLDVASSSTYWLRANTALVHRIDGGSLQVLLFASPPPATVEKSVRFDNGVHLQFAPLPANVQPGDDIVLRLGWSTAQPLIDDVAIFVQLLGPDGALVAQSDGDAVNGLAPTHAWAPGTRVDDLRGLLVPLNAQAGDYNVITGLYSRSDGRRVLVDGVDHVVIARVRVTP